MNSHPSNYFSLFSSVQAQNLDLVFKYLLCSLLHAFRFYKKSLLNVDGA